MLCLAGLRRLRVSDVVGQGSKCFGVPNNRSGHDRVGMLPGRVRRVMCQIEG